MINSTNPSSKSATPPPQQNNFQGHAQDLLGPGEGARPHPTNLGGKLTQPAQRLATKTKLSGIRASSASPKYPARPLSALGVALATGVLRLALRRRGNRICCSTRSASGFSNNPIARRERRSDDVYFSHPREKSYCDNQPGIQRLGSKGWQRDRR